MIKEILYDYFDKIRIENEKKEFDDEKEINFAPSYLCDCKRKIFYKKRKIKESNPTETHAYIKFELGHAVHRMLQDIFKKIGIWQEGEDFKEKQWQGLKWIYRHDGSLLIQMERYLIEIKSMYKTGWTSIEKEPKHEHVLQLFSCMEFEGIDNGILLYVGRDNGFLIEYNFIIEWLRNSRYGADIDQRIKELKELKKKIELNILPDQDFSLYLKNAKGIISDSFQKNNKKYETPWQCRKTNGHTYCAWRDLCWKKELEKINNHKFFIDGEFID